MPVPLQGVVRWPELLRPICNYCMSIIRVPVGNYMGPGSGGAKITSLAFNSIANLACSRQRTPIEHLGKLLMYSLRPGSAGKVVSAYPALEPLEAVRTFSTLLEHFYQVPNAGECALENTVPFEQGSVSISLYKYVCYKETQWWE